MARPDMNVRCPPQCSVNPQPDPSQARQSSTLLAPDGWSEGEGSAYDLAMTTPVSPRRPLRRLLALTHEQLGMPAGLRSSMSECVRNLTSFASHGARRESRVANQAGVQSNHEAPKGTAAARA